MELDNTLSHPLPTVLYEQNELSDITDGTLRPGGIALTKEILTSCQPTPGSTALDVGCGLGRSVDLMSSSFALQVTGLDPSGAMLVQAVEGVPAASFLQGEAGDIPCKTAIFDTVISECVLSLTGDTCKSLEEMGRVLRPGGTLILTDIYRKNAKRKPDLPNLQSCISHALALKDIEKGLLYAGFTVKSLRDRSDLLKQLAGQIIFSYGSLEKFWQLFMGQEAARQTCCVLAGAPLGYYVLIARKE